MEDKPFPLERGRRAEYERPSDDFAAPVAGAPNLSIRRAQGEFLVPKAQVYIPVSLRL